MSNQNLLTAKNKKNDEFYTRLEDIQKELDNYKEYFKDKIILERRYIMYYTPYSIFLI